MFFAISAILSLLTIGLCLISRRARLTAAFRVLHIRMVLVTIVYAVLSTVLYVEVLRLIDIFLSVPVVRVALFYAMPSANISAAFFWVVTVLSCLILSVVYCALVEILHRIWMRPVSRKPGFNAGSRLGRFFLFVSSLFYDVDEDEASLKLVGHNVGQWIRLMRNWFGFLLLIEAVVIPLYLQLDLLIINDLLISKLVKSIYLIPVISLFILDQMIIFLMSDLRNDDAELETEENQLSHVGDYLKMLPIYESLFGGDALISTYLNDHIVDRSLFSGPDLEQLHLADSPELLSAICRNVNNAVQPLSTQYVNALTDLINGKSVAVFDSYRGEFNYYYLSYLQQSLFLRRKALIICDTRYQVEDIKAQYGEILRAINKVHPIWRIHDVMTMPANQLDADILVCTEEEIASPTFFKEYGSFLAYVHDVLVLHPYDIICRQDIFSRRFFRSLARRNIQFAFFLPENSTDAKNVLEDLLDGQEIALYNNFNSTARACILCWRQESSYKTQTAISENLYNDFGVAYTIAVLAITLNVSRINIHAPGSVPLESYRSTVKSYIQELSDKAFKKDSVSIDSIVRHNPLSAFHEKELSFDILYDAYNNLLNVTRLALSTSADVSAMIHIVSRPYMLRDYFADNISALCQDYEGIQHFVPFISGGLVAPSVALLVRLWEDGMTCEEVVSYMQQFGVQEDNVEKLLEMALKLVYPAGSPANVYQCFTFGSEEYPLFRKDEDPSQNQYSYVYTRKVSLASELIYNDVCAMSVRNVRVSGSHNEILPIAAQSVYNYFLPMQMHAFSGKWYTIRSVDNGQVWVEPEETIEREESYTTLFEIPRASLFGPARQSKTDDNVRCDLFDLDIIRRITGYFVHKNGLDFNSDFTHRSVLESPIETILKTRCLRIRISFSFGPKYHGSAALLTVLFRGLMETVLPRNYQDILVLSGVETDAFDPELFVKDTGRQLREDPIPSDWLEAEDFVLPMKRSILELFPSLEGTDLMTNTENSIDLYLVDISGVENAVLETILNDVPRLISILHSYLDWALANPTLRHAYLKFGYNQIPGFFDVTTVFNCLEHISQRKPAPGKALAGRTIVFDSSAMEHCSFCGRTVAVSAWRFDDKRIMCEDCYKHRTTERKEVKELLQQAYDTLENKYAITLPRGIKIRFKSAASIAKAAGSMQDRRILGFYNEGRRELWVERGGPATCVLSTLMHELTHAWQYANLDMKHLDLKYIEGHSTYVEIQCTRALGDTVYADFWESNMEDRNDPYGEGYRYWKRRMRQESDKNIFHHICRL